jgi:hypothetical protein
MPRNVICRVHACHRQMSNGLGMDTYLRQGLHVGAAGRSSCAPRSGEAVQRPGTGCANGQSMSQVACRMTGAVLHPIHSSEPSPKSSPSLRRWLAWLLASSQVISCASSLATGTPAPACPAGASFGLVRYRLPLRNNPTDPKRALHCYADCQPRSTPEDYMSCLEACPGFETTEGEACGPEEVPPIAVCFTAHQIPPASEPEPGTVVIGTVAGFAVVVALASVCASSNTQCSAVAPEAAL